MDTWLLILIVVVLALAVLLVALYAWNRARRSGHVIATGKRDPR
jgi:uncharacterized protein involved in outer membrane biogenesis